MRTYVLLSGLIKVVAHRAAECVCFYVPHLVNIQVIGLAVLYSKVGLRKMVSCGGLRPRPVPPPHSLGSCQAKVFPFSD